MRRLLGLPIVSLALLMGLTSCGNGSMGQPSTPAPTAAQTVGGSLEFSQVEELTAPRFQSDPVCRYGEWHENSTGVDDEHRAAVTFFRQFDCYESKENTEGIPDRVQQSIYVEFSDAAAAKKYAEDEAVVYTTLVDRTKVVVAGTGLDTVDMRAYLADLQAACTCGEIIAPTG